MTMKRLLGPLLAACLVAVCLLLGGCGDSTSDTASDPNGQPSTYFFNNGNACGWTGPQGTSTGYKSLGHGYSGGTFYGKCSTGMNTTGTGTFPGTASDDPSRCVDCPCF